MKYLKKISSVSALLTLILGLTFTLSYAQTNSADSSTYWLKGKVVNANTNKGVAHATITLLNNTPQEASMQSDTTDTTTYGNMDTTMHSDTMDTTMPGDTTDTTMRSDSTDSTMRSDTMDTNNMQSGSSYHSSSNMAESGTNLNVFTMIKTNRKGKFKLKNIPSGTYTLKITHNNFDPWEQQVTIHSNGYRTIKLTPKK